MYTRTIFHSQPAQGTDELKHKKKKDCGVELRQMKRYSTCVRLRPTVAQIQKIPIRARCSFFLQIGGPYTGKSQRWGALRIDGKSGGELGVYFFSTTDQ